MNDKVYWVWLQSCIGYAKSFWEILDHFGTPDAVYNASDEELNELEYLSRRKSIRKRIDEHNLEEALDTVEICAKHKIHIVTFNSEFYPASLKKISNPPMVLYVRGDLQCLSAEFPVAVIGSRTPCDYGVECAERIVSQLVIDYGATIVSGGAIGIDSVAHSSAINSGGKTLHISGCGHGNGYLPENSELRKNVFAHGALISEYPPYTSPSHQSFPLRNRIISGLSKAVVIVEAGERSGTFSTAKHAIKQGRPLFVLPGDINSGNFAGSNQLIVEGATAVFSAIDIISKLDGVKRKTPCSHPKTNTPFDNINEKAEQPQKKRRKNKKKSEEADITFDSDISAEKNITVIKKILPETISKNAEMVYNLMSEGKCTLDELANSCDLFPAKILAALTELELEGYAEKTTDAYRII